MQVRKDLIENLIGIVAEYCNSEHWITVHPHGKDGKGQPLLVEDGETSKEAVERKFGGTELTSESKTIQEAESFAEKNGVKVCDYSAFNVETANNINKAIMTIPRDMRPDYIVDFDALYKKGWMKKTKQSNNSFGVSLTYNEMAKDKKGKYHNIDSTIAFNSKYNTFDKIQKKKEGFNKTVTNWYFNTKGEATAFHEIGHVFANSQGIDDEFGQLAEKWYNDTKIGMLKPVEKEFGGKNSKYSEAFAEAYAGYFTKNENLPKEINDYMEKLVNKKITLMSKERGEELFKRIRGK
jgi:hypothetical protein